MIQAIQLILALSFLVVIHELGHFCFARIFGVRVEKFYMFFNPQFSLFRAKKFDGKWHFAFCAPNVKDDDEWAKHPESTEWGIGWVPFGGYCAIVGMVDETHSADKMKAQVQPWEFRAKKAWQRLLIILGGILVNFVAALIIFGALLFQYGSDTLPLKNAPQGLYFSQIMLDEGFKQHDRILTINGTEPEEIGEAVQKIILEGQRDVVVLRGTDTVALTMSDDLGKRYLALQNDFDRKERDKARADKGYQKNRYILMTEFIPFVVDSVLPDNAAWYGGLQKEDQVLAVNGLETPCFVDVQQELRKHPCDSVILTLLRGEDTIPAHVFIGDRCQLGVIMKSKLAFMPVEHRDYGFLESIPAGIKFGWDILVTYVKQLRLIFTREGAQSVGGFGAIGSMFPNVWNWQYFWHMTAFLSLILAFMNFLPIPALDGGYILFLLVEMITGRKPSDKFLEKANEVGFWLLIALLLFANGNDILRLFF